MFLQVSPAQISNVLSLFVVPIATRRKMRQQMVVLAAILAVVVGLLLPGMALANDDMHIVRHGEYLSDIAKYYNVGLDELIAVNYITDPSVIVPGQQLVIPGTRTANPYGAPVLDNMLPASDGYYTVKRGDALSVIAYDHDMSLDDIMRLNGIAHPRNIWVGQELRVTARVEPIIVRAVPQPASVLHVVRGGETLSQIAETYATTTKELLVANGLPNVNFVFQGQRLRVPDAIGDPDVLAVAGAPTDGHRRIEIDLSEQMLSAYQGDVRVMHTSVSTGKESTPTIIGDFSVGTKYEKQHMWGDDYDLPNVPWVMYFEGAYAIHGAYWHTNFGTPQSHGCINMRPEEAEQLFKWAPYGTEVVINE